MQARYDFRPGAKAGADDWPADAACALAWSRLPPELLPGPFISLVLSWTTSLQVANSLPLLPTPPALSCSAKVHVRCSQDPGRSLLGRYWKDLDILRNLLSPGEAGAEPCGMPQGALGDAVERFIAEEARLATSSVLLDLAPPVAPAAGEGGNSGDARATTAHMERPQISKDKVNEEERPGRDFVDRLWLEVASRYATAQGLVPLVGAVLRELGRPDGIAPPVRRDNTSELAILIQDARKMSKARQYSRHDARTLNSMVASWEERCQQFSDHRNALRLVRGIGVECLRKDFLHIITRQGYITAQDMSYFVESSQPAAEDLRRLRCLHHLAELALLCTRHLLCSDAMRHLVLQAAEHYQRPPPAEAANTAAAVPPPLTEQGGSHEEQGEGEEGDDEGPGGATTTNSPEVSETEGTASPVFTVPLFNASTNKLLSIFPSTEPSSFEIRCGQCAVRAQRAVAPECGEGAACGGIGGGGGGRDAAQLADRFHGGSSGPGVWKPPVPNCPFEYHLTVYDAICYAKQ